MATPCCAHCRTPLRPEQDLCSNCGLPTHIEGQLAPVALSIPRTLQTSCSLYVRTWPVLCLICLAVSALSVYAFCVLVVEGRAGLTPPATVIAAAWLILTPPAVSLYMQLLQRAPLRWGRWLVGGLRLFPVTTLCLGPWLLDTYSRSGLPWLLGPALVALGATFVPTLVPLLTVDPRPVRRAWSVSWFASRGLRRPLLGLTLLVGALQALVSKLILDVGVPLLVDVDFGSPWVFPVVVCTLYLTTLGFPLAVASTLHQCFLQLHRLR